MTLGILTAVWRRPELTQLMLSHTTDLRPENADVKVVAVRSRSDPESAPDVEGVIYAEAPNKPLSRKFTAGMNVLRKMDVDGVVILGSDDLVNEKYLQRIAQLMQNHKSDYLQAGGLWVYDVATQRCMYGEAGRIGGGRMLSRRLLDMIDWRPWQRSDLGGLDRSMDARLDPIVLPYVIKRMPARGEILLSIKSEMTRSETQAWTYDDLTGLALARYHGTVFLNSYFPTISEKIQTLPQAEV